MQEWATTAICQATVTLYLRYFIRGDQYGLFVGSTYWPYQNTFMNTVYRFALSLFIITSAMQTTAQPALRIFMDCGNSDLCDLDYIRLQLPAFDFVRDRFNADVHILLSSQPTGNGGELHTVVFTGLTAFRQDTLVFSTAPNAATDTKRSSFIRYIKMGLIPYLLKNGNDNQVEISFKKPDSASAQVVKKDPWRNWAFMVSGNMNFSGSTAYKENAMNTAFSVAKVTPSIRTDLRLSAWYTKNIYTYEEDNKEVQLKTIYEYYSAEHNFVRSLSRHWSWAYKVEYERSTYSNYKHNIELSTGIEYNIYPYTSSSNKFLTIRSMLGNENRHYFEQTLYGKNHEQLFYDELGIYAFYVQPWGKVSGSLNWYNYLHDVSKNNLSVYSRVEISIVKGLSLSFKVNASRIRDQMNLPAAGASPEEVLLRVRSISSSYNYYTGFGINYRFGSKVNNIVNARFTSPGM